MNEKAPILRVTTDYSSFHIMDGNRGTSHKSKIVKSIKAVGYVPSPIICNEKMQVIDGQGRLEACKELNLPVYYIVIPGLGIKHCTSMNISQTNWSVRDFVNSHAKQGNKNYINLIRLMEKHPAASLGVVVSAASDPSITVDNDTIKSGRLCIDDSFVPVADDILFWLEENVFPYKNRISGRFEYLCYAMIFAYTHSSANRGRLSAILRDYSYDFTPIAPTKHALEQIERFYNRNLKQNKVYFLVEYDKYLVTTKAGYYSRWSIKARAENNVEELQYE